MINLLDFDLKIAEFACIFANFLFAPPKFKPFLTNCGYFYIYIPKSLLHLVYANKETLIA